jgi:pilus assembly protein Flp/PilA
MKRLSGFIQDDYGATAIEYAFLASLISMAAIAAMSAVGSALSGTFSTVAASLG